MCDDTWTFLPNRTWTTPSQFTVKFGVIYNVVTGKTVARFINGEWVDDNGASFGLTIEGLKIKIT